MDHPGTSAAGRGQAFTGAFEPSTLRILPAGEVLHLHLLRHGEVERMRERVLFGQEDVALSAEGLRQGERLVRWLRASEPGPWRVVASDLSRCRLLGEGLARAAGVELELEPRLREQHLGAWQGRTWEDVTAEEPERVRAYWAAYAETRPPGGESLADVAERVLAWWSELAPGAEGRPVVVATHVGVLRVLVSSLLGLPLGQALRLAPATGSHTSLLVSAAGAVLQSFGERPWLHGDAAGGGAG